MANIDADGRASFAELNATAVEMPVSVWATGKSQAQKNKRVLQSVHNYWLKLALRDLGWTLEPYVSQDEESLQRADFHKGAKRKKVVVEVELGNAARIDSALLKFQTAHYDGTLKLAVLVVAVQALANETDSGLATFEAAVHRIRHTPGQALPFSLVVIGLSASPQTQVLDWERSRFTSPSELSGNGGDVCLAHAISELREGVVLEGIGPPMTETAWQEATDLSKALNRPTRAAWQPLEEPVPVSLNTGMGRALRRLAAWSPGAWWQGLVQRTAPTPEQVWGYARVVAPCA